MVAPNAYQLRVDEIKNLLFSNQMRQAVARLMDFVRDFADNKKSEHKVIVLSMTFNRVEAAERTAILAFKPASDEREELVLRVLALMDEIEESIAERLAA